MGADQIGQRTVRPIVRAICDQKGGQRVFHLISPLQVSIQRETIEIGVNEHRERRLDQDALSVLRCQLPAKE